jgi:DNA-binding CsgD family transcriptional regulator
VKVADQDETLEIWEALASGKWSLLDYFDNDGKRFVVAVKNAAPIDKRLELSTREREVSALAALGHRDKEIANALGLSIPAVTGALHRARKKLGVTSRAALAMLWRAGGDEVSSRDDETSSRRGRSER